MSGKMKGNLMLMTTAIIWGTAFVAQKNGMDLIGPIAFNGIRTVIGGVVLLPVIFFMGRKHISKGTAGKSPETERSNEQNAAEKPDIKKAGKANVAKAEQAVSEKQERKLLVAGGIICGLALMIAGNIQQVGLFYTTAGKAAFITPLYVVLVPLIGVFLKKKIRPIMWMCVFASIIGLYFLCIPVGEGFGGINKGDMCVLVCAFFFAIHILAVDYFSPKVDGIKLSCIQFFVAGIVSILLMFPLDPALGFGLPSLHNILASWFPLCYVGIMSCGVAYTFQVVGQSYTNPTAAAMILCLESVFGVIAGMVFLGEAMALREIIGCIIMFTAIIAAQLPGKEERIQARSHKNEQG